MEPPIIACFNPKKLVLDLDFWAAGFGGVNPRGGPTHYNDGALVRYSGMFTPIGSFCGFSQIYKFIHLYGYIRDVLFHSQCYVNEYLASFNSEREITLAIRTKSMSQNATTMMVMPTETH